MLRTLTVKRFKSLDDVGPVDLAPLTVLFGPNAAGKSNFLDAIQVLSRLASERTLADALSEPIRGRPLEAFSLPASGLPALLAAESASFSFEAVLTIMEKLVRYRTDVAVKPSSGVLSVADEYLATLGKTLEPRGSPAIERVEDKMHVRRKSKPGHPRYEEIGLNHTLLSDRRFSGVEYHAVQQAREELSSWRTYYLDPRVAMRTPQPPKEVTDIGPLGEFVAPFLYRLHGENVKAFDAVRRTLRTLIPSVEDLSVDLDVKRGVLDVEIRQDETPFSSRVVSEGTLRVLALACVAANPWGGTLVAFEEPENGVHPRRIELIAQMLISMATEERNSPQIIVTTHSPIFCGSVLSYARNHPKAVALYNVVREGRWTRLRRFDPPGPLFDDVEIARALSESSEDRAVFEGLALRGLLDG